MPARLIQMQSFAVTHQPPRHRFRTFTLVVVLLAGVSLFAACGPGGGTEATGGQTGDGQTGDEGTVTGVVVRSPVCPVARVSQSCAPHPVAGAEVSLWRDGRLVATTQTDEHGRFRLSGGTGEAEVRARTPSGGYMSRTTRAVTLRRGTPTEVRLLLDSGIR